MKDFKNFIRLLFLVPFLAHSQSLSKNNLSELKKEIASNEIDQSLADPEKPIPGDAITALIDDPNTTSENCASTGNSKEKKTPSDKVEILMIVEGTTANQGYIKYLDEDSTKNNTYKGYVENNIKLLQRATAPIYKQDTSAGANGNQNNSSGGTNFYNGGFNYYGSNSNTPPPNSSPPPNVMITPTPTTPAPMIQVNNPISPPKFLNAKELKQWAEEANKVYDPSMARSSSSPDLEKSLYVEAIIQTIPKIEKTSDESLSKQIANAVSAVSNSEEDKYQMLSMISDRLYSNYNMARNPGYNNSENNPNGEKLPGGTLSLSEIFTAAANQDESKGGVCNDISEAVAKIGQELFPNDDVLAINAGTHFGVMIANKNSTHVIDGNSEYEMKNQLNLGTDVITSNVRVSKISNNHLKEIAVMDTQLGELVKTTTGSPVPVLRSGANFNKAVSQAKFTLTENEKKKRALTVGAGTGNLLGSNVQVIAAKYSTDTQKTSAYATVGADAQQMKEKDLGNEYHIILAAGFDQKLIRYVNPKVKVDFSSGVHLNTSYGMFANNKTVFYDIYGMSGGLDALNKVSIENKPKTEKDVSLKGQAMLVNTLGSRNWGATTGATSEMTGAGMLKALGKMNFHVNQLNVTGTVNKPLNKNTSSLTQASYVGSNVGQSASLISGINVQAKNGANIFYFVGGDTSKIKGYQTKNSLLVGTNGAKTGVSYQGKKFTGSAGVSNLAPNQQPQIDTSLKYMIGGGKKKKTPPPTSSENP